MSADPSSRLKRIATVSLDKLHRVLHRRSSLAPTTASAASPAPTTASAASPAPTTASAASPAPTTASAASPVPTTASAASPAPTAPAASPAPITASAASLAPTTASADSPEMCHRSRVTLKFTGSLDLAAFNARCEQHDFWYHSYYFDNGFAVRGDYDAGKDVIDYGFPSDMTGMSVLDIGAGSGWYATYFEQLGADVTVVDARGYCDFDVFGRDHYPSVTLEKPVPDRTLPDGRGVYYSSVSKGLWIMKEILGLRAHYVNGRVYEICPQLFGGRKFDLVFMGSVLMHLRDPIGALMAAHSVCADRLIATTFMRDIVTEPPLMQMEEGAGDGINWWVPNRPCLAQWLKAAGFSKFDIDRRVRLTADKPYEDEAGRSTAVDQVHQLVHAFR